MKEEEETLIYLDIVMEDDDPDETKEAVRKSLSSESFREVITTLLYPNLLLAIKNGKERFIAFRLPHHNQDYIIKKNQYKNLLNTMLRYAEEDEDYDRCVLIKKIIENL